MVSMKRLSLEMKWSEGATTMVASGFMWRILVAAYAMQGAVLRLYGSARMFSGGRPGRCLRTMSTYADEVTTMIFCSGTIFRNRSYVSWMKLLPIPRMSRNCLGMEFLLIGQKRLPTPPAIITQ